MKRVSILKALALVGVLFAGGAARAGVPLVNIEGQGGIALNPLAYPAADPEPGLRAGPLEIAKPRLGAWYVNFVDASIDWTAMGIATSFNKRLEISFGYEVAAISTVYNVHKENVGAKLVLLAENQFGLPFLPAIAVGAMFKHTTFPVASPTDRNGWDAYLVATKLVTQLPAPVLLSVGGLTTKGQVNGLLGFNSERKIVVFANADVVPVSWLALGVEYKMGPDYRTAGVGYVDADYFEVHAAWFVNKSFTLVGSYARAGKRGPSPFGLGDALVLSGQYAF